MTQTSLTNNKTVKRINLQLSQDEEIAEMNEQEILHTTPCMKTDH